MIPENLKSHLEFLHIQMGQFYQLHLSIHRYCESLETYEETYEYLVSLLFDPIKEIEEVEIGQEERDLVIFNCIILSELRNLDDNLVSYKEIDEYIYMYHHNQVNKFLFTRRSEDIFLVVLFPYVQMHFISLKEMVRMFLRESFEDHASICQYFNQTIEETIDYKIKTERNSVLASILNFDCPCEIFGLEYSNNLATSRDDQDEYFASLDELVTLIKSRFGVTSLQFQYI
jgi:hypothetical protein